MFVFLKLIVVDRISALVFLQAFAIYQQSKTLTVRSGYWHEKEDFGRKVVGSNLDARKVFFCA